MRRIYSSALLAITVCALLTGAFLFIVFHFFNKEYKSFFCCEQSFLTDPLFVGLMLGVGMMLCLEYLCRRFITKTHKR